MRKRPPDRKNAILWVFLKMVTALFCNRVVGVSPLGRSGYKIGIFKYWRNKENHNKKKMPGNALVGKAPSELGKKTPAPGRRPNCAGALPPHGGARFSAPGSWRQTLPNAPGAGGI